MKLEEAKEIIENEIDGCDVFSCEMCKRDCTCDNSPCVEKGCQLAEAVDTVLQEIEHLQKENEELKEKIIEVEKENQVQKAVIFEDSISKEKIRELIELWKPKLEETDKREEEAQTQEERVVLKCIGIRLDERIKTLQDLLKEE